MVVVSYSGREINAKIVYYGPGLSGKTTNLEKIYDSVPETNRGRMVSMKTQTDRTLFFDLLPLDLGDLQGMKTRLLLYTVPGQVYYNSTRQLVLKGADGIVFVADSQDFALDANLESLQNLEDNLKRQGVRIREIPLVLQYNKRDLPNAMPPAEMDGEINKLGVPRFETVATTGIGVEETLKGITQLVLAHLIKKYNLEGSEPLDIQILNAPSSHAPARDSLWEDADERHVPPPAPTPPPAAQPMRAPFVVDDAGDDDNIPLVATELIGSAPPPPPAKPASNAKAYSSHGSPFEDVTDFYSTPGLPPLQPYGSDEGSMEVPMTSIEIPLPPGILDSLPVLDTQTQTATISAPAAERRATDGLVREVNIPLNLSLEEIRQHRRLRLKITLDVNLLP
jgi:signal recognition particle receptor subunit beta